jgi:murein DD-endopeptidase MepM/ murein hydrolase activator NlpD
MKLMGMMIGCFLMGNQVGSAQSNTPLEPPFRVVDLDVGESKEVSWENDHRATVKLVHVQETRDEVCFAVRRADVTVEIDGQSVPLVSGNYELPKTVGRYQVDCAITSGNNSNGTPSFWGLDKAARIRVWKADAPWINPGTFQYPVKQKWFANSTQMANEPVFVDAGEKPGKRSIYYHSGLDIGGSEGLVEIVAATDGLVVSVADKTMAAHETDTPVAPRYDVVYLLDERGWYYRYSHMKEIAPGIVLGRVVKKGDRIGFLGKEGGSGGWSHQHFEIKSRQPSGKWGTVEGYAFLWEAYLQEYQPRVIAVARPHHVVQTGDTVTLDGSKSWAREGGIQDFQWEGSDGSKASGPKVRRTYNKPGRYCETLRVTDRHGNQACDFTVVFVFDRSNPNTNLPSIHANYSPTFDLRPGMPIVFKVRSFGNTHAKETWDFGDGTPTIQVESDGNRAQHAPDGYAATTHAFSKPGHYVVSVSRTTESGITATDRLWVHVQGDTPAIKTKAAWEAGKFFQPPESFKDQYGKYRSPLLFADGTKVTRPDQWPRRRQEILHHWHGLLGAWPELITQPKLEMLESNRRENFVQWKVRFQLTPHDMTEGYLLVPDGQGKRPAAVTVYYEPETAIGQGGDHRDFALQLARRGFVVLSIGAKEASQARTYGFYYPSLQEARVQPLSMLAYAAANAWHVLASRPEVDDKRIGIVGHSFGGKWAMFASCLFEKFACAAWSDPGIVFDEARPNVNYWEPWYLGYHPQPWRTRGVITPDNPAHGLYPQLVAQGRDLHELHALMAPRPFLVSGGSEDPPARWEALNHSRDVNRLLGYTDRVAMTNRPEHSPNGQSNEQIYTFFQHFLME